MQLVHLGISDAPTPNTIAKYIPTWPQKDRTFCCYFQSILCLDVQQIREATPYGAMPEYLFHDNDSIFTSAYFQQFLSNTNIKFKKDRLPKSLAKWY